MDEIMLADAGAAPPVETRVSDGHVYIGVPTDVDAPQQEVTQKEDTQICADDDKTVPLTLVVTMLNTCEEMVLETLNICKDIWDELGHLRTYIDCLDTCVFFFFCHAITSLILGITICCRCCTSMLKSPDRIKKRTARTHKAFAFFAQHLSSLWVTSLLVLFARYFLFRPMDVKPHLASSTVHQFELTSMGTLHFNVTAYVLFHNGHSFYKIDYQHFAGSFIYADVKLGPADDNELPTFMQKPHENTLKRLPFAGRLRNASGRVDERFARERAEGLLQMLVRIRDLLRYGFWPFKGDYFTVYDCPLISPSPQMGEPAVSSPAWCKIVDV